MKKYAVISALVALVALSFGSVGHSAPKQAKGLVSRITDALLGEKNTPGVLVPILQDEDATSQLVFEIQDNLASKIELIEYTPRPLTWVPGDIDKDATFMTFKGNKMASFKLDSDVKVNRGNFFQIYRNDLQLSTDDQMLQVKLEDQVVESSSGSKTYTHSRYSQTYKGVPVIGAQYALHEEGGKVRSGSGKVARGIDLDVTPTVSMEDARNIALESIAAESYSWQSGDCVGTPICVQNPNPTLQGWFCSENVNGDCTPVDNTEYPWVCVGDFSGVGSNGVVEPMPGYCSEPEGTLSIFSNAYSMQPGSYHLVWNFRIFTAVPWGERDVMLDAHTGEVLANVDAKFYQEVPPDYSQAVDSVCSGETRYNGQQNFPASYIPDPTDAYVLRLMGDQSIPRPLISLNTNYPDATWPPPDPASDNVDYYFWTPNTGSCDFSQGEDLLGASVWWGLTGSYGFYEHFNWLGQDGLGKRAILASLHYIPGASSSISLIPNVDPTDPYAATVFMNFAGMTSEISNEVVSLVDVGHEYAHAVMIGMMNNEVSKDLQAEFWALMEGIADVLSVATEAHVLAQPIDWCEGEERRLDGNCIVDYSDPKAFQFADTYGGEYWYEPDVNSVGVVTYPCSGANGDPWCYRNSGIFSYWFYLLVHGGSGVNDNEYAYSIQGIGAEETITILLDAIRYGLKFTDGFYEMSEHTIASAKKLYPDNPAVAETVQNAWAAVGVGQEVDTGHFSPKNGAPDVSAWPVRFTWEADKSESQLVLVSLSPAFDKSYVLEPQQDIPLLGEPGSGIDSMNRVRRSTEMNLRSDVVYYWKVVTLGDGASEPESGSGNGIFGQFSLIPYLKQIVQLNDTSNPMSALYPGYSTTPTYPGSTESPIRYFKTSKMKPTLVAPKAPTKAHPWQAEFMVGQVKGAKSVNVDLTDMETGEFKRITVHADDVIDSSDNTYRIKKDLRIDHHYSWKAWVIGPQVGDSDASQFPNTGQTSETVEFWTNIPTSTLITPDPDMEVQPNAYFQWYEIQGIDEILNNGANYRLMVSESSDMTDPILVVDHSGLYAAESFEMLPPTDASGQPADYYWTVQPIGPSEFGNELGDQATPIHFTVDASATKPTGRNPAGADRVGYNDAFFDFYWIPVDGAESYIFDVYHTNNVHEVSIPVDMSMTYEQLDGSLATENIAGLVDVSRITTDLNGYCWTVKGVFQGHPGLPSDPLCYTLTGSKPVPISPLNGNTYNKTSLYAEFPFSWEQAYAPNGLWLRVWQDDYCHWHDTNYEKVNVMLDGDATMFSTTNLKNPSVYSWTISTLKSNGQVSRHSDCQTFYVQIVPDDDDEEESPDEPQICNTVAAPTIAQPNPLAAPPDTYTQDEVTVQWGSVPNAVSYDWELRSSGSALTPIPVDDEGEGVVIASDNTTSTSVYLKMRDIIIGTGVPYPPLYLDSDVYYFTVKAMNECGDASEPANTWFLMKIPQ